LRTQTTKSGLESLTEADKLRRFIAEYLGIDADQVTDEAHLSDDLGIDWLDQLELMIIVEDEFVGVELSDASAYEVVGDLIRHVDIKAANTVPAFCKSAA
jgi:acyl carrier protein